MNKRILIKYITGISLIVVSVTGLSSCGSNRDLQKAPGIDVQNIVRDSAYNTGDTATIANIPWKDYFSDQKLTALIAEGIDNNYDLKIAVSRIKQAEASLSMANAALLPSVSAGAQINHTRTSNGTHGTDVLGYTSNVNTLGFSASWEIDLWGKLSNLSKAKYASYLSSVEYKNLVQTELVSNIAITYYQLLTLDEQLRITRETTSLLRKSTETMKALKESGQQNQAAVEQSNALLCSTILTIPQIENQIRQTENKLCALLGRDPGPVDRAAISNQTIPDMLAYGVPAQLLAKRPDVKQAELQLRYALANTAVARASFYPSLTINSMTFGLAAGEFSNFFKPENLAAEVIAGLTQPIFNKKQIRGNLKIAEAQQNEALLSFRSTVLSAGEEVSNILFGYQSSLKKNEYRQQQIISLTNAVEYTQELLLAGEANYTEVLSAQQNLLSAQLNKVNDMSEQLIYTVNLYRALGGGSF